MLSIKNINKYEEIIKYSKFISLIYPVKSKQEIEECLDKVKKEYPNASHYCYGYVIDNLIKSSDDKEPSMTAGKQILKQIIQHNLNYVLIIVVRYFGGVKLGVGPLTRTYAKMAQNVIEEDNIVNLTEGWEIVISFEYDKQKNIDYLLKDSKILDKKYDSIITYHAIIQKDILNKLNDFDIKIIKETYIEGRE